MLFFSSFFFVRVCDIRVCSQGKFTPIPPFLPLDLLLYRFSPVSVIR